MNALVEGACGDLRLILGQLQMVRLSRNTLNYDDVKVGVASRSVDDPPPSMHTQRCRCLAAGLPAPTYGLTATRTQGRQGANKDADLSPFDCSRR
eukprot:365682-Chlamydomonas_euryale.AAC.24